MSTKEHQPRRQYKGMHKWTDNDNVVAYYLYRFSHLHAKAFTESIAERLGISANSMGIKIANFEYLGSSGKSGLSGFSTQAEAIYKQYRNLTDEEFRVVVERLLSRKGIDLPTLAEVSSYNEYTDEALEAKKQQLERQLADLKAKLRRS